MAACGAASANSTAAASGAELQCLICYGARTCSMTAVQPRASNFTPWEACLDSSIRSLVSYIIIHIR